MSELDCAVCLEILKPPILMCSCSVNFCRECLLKITSFSTQRQLTCPACRKSHQNDLSTFVRNRLVERMIEKSQSPTGSNIPMAGSNIQPVPSAPTHVYPDLRSVFITSTSDKLQ